MQSADSDREREREGKRDREKMTEHCLNEPYNGTLNLELSRKDVQSTGTLPRY